MREERPLKNFKPMLYFEFFLAVSQIYTVQCGHLNSCIQVVSKRPARGYKLGTSKPRGTRILGPKTLEIHCFDKSLEDALFFSGTKIRVSRGLDVPSLYHLAGLLDTTWIQLFK